MTEQSDRPDRDATTNLLGDVVSGVARLIRGELALARAEAKRSLNDAASALGKLVVAAILGATALNVLAGTAVAGLVALGLSPLWAGVAVGAGLLLVVFSLVHLGLAQLSPSNLAPKRMMKNLRQDAETLTSMVGSDAASRHHS
ncbi:phage holin family protein [Tabrizicola sp.]|uniref:phage holin family protein n=1 Tax=Tabrizicola sp. TaxID=2005166 RepID=UPI00286C0180|nr:phage holin family protein [Tabrizicola sp.]